MHKQVKFNLTARKHSEKADIIIGKAELISYGVFFCIALFITWTTRVDPNSYYHLAFSIVAVWIMLASIAQGVMSPKPERRFLVVSLVLALSQLSAVLFCAYYCQDLLMVPALSVTLLSMGQANLPQLCISKVLLVVFTAITTNQPTQVKAAAFLVCIDFFFMLVKMGRKYYEKFEGGKGGERIAAKTAAELVPEENNKITISLALPTTKEKVEIIGKNEPSTSTRKKTPLQRLGRVAMIDQSTQVDNLRNYSVNSPGQNVERFSFEK